jgi:hypothetical protein
MSEYDLNRPWLYRNDWLIFPDTTLSSINLSDCNDTISGICYYDKSLEECISICKNDPDKLCAGGYYIKAKSGENFCVPLRTDLGTSTSPYYRFRRKDFYPVLDNMTSEVFVSTKYFPFPPNTANTIFYKDHFVFQNIETKMKLGLEENNQTSEQTVFSKVSNLHVQLLPLETTQTYIEVYVPVKHGDMVAVNIPGTSLILRKNIKNSMLGWILRATNVNIPNNTFQIFSKNKMKKIGEPLYYGEKFYLKYQGGTVIYDEHLESLRVINFDHEDALQDNHNVYFNFDPRTEVYYCENNECKTVQLSQCKPDKLSATYNNIAVSRNPKCWGKCDPKHNKSNFPRTLVIVISIILVLVVIALIITRLK